MQTEVNSLRVRAAYDREKCARKCGRYTDRREPGERNSLSTVDGGRRVSCGAIFSAQNPVAFSYFLRQNVSALSRVKLIGLTSHANLLSPLPRLNAPDGSIKYTIP